MNLKDGKNQSLSWNRYGCQDFLSVCKIVSALNIVQQSAFMTWLVWSNWNKMVLLIFQ